MPARRSRSASKVSRHAARQVKPAKPVKVDTASPATGPKLQLTPGDAVVRDELVNALKPEIAQGGYDTQQRLMLAMIRLLDDLNDEEPSLAQ